MHAHRDGKTKEETKTEGTFRHPSSVLSSIPVGKTQQSRLGDGFRCRSNGACSYVAFLYNCGMRFEDEGKMWVKMAVRE